MAITYTDLLGLKLSTDFDDALNFNFRKLDTLGSAYDVTADGNLVIRSQVGITFEANSPDLGGSSSGGDIDFGGSSITGLTLTWDNVTDKTANTLPDLDTFIDSYATIVAHQAHVDATSAVHGILGNFVGDTDTQTLTNKTLSASTNTLSDITDSSIDAAAAIAGSKIDPTFTAVVSSTLGLRMSSTYNTTLVGAASGQTADLTFYLPPNYGTSGQILQTDGSGATSWESVSGITPPVTFTWAQAAADTLAFNHALGTTKVSIDIYDENGVTIEVDSETRTDADNVTLTRLGSPTGDWTVIVTSISD
jgi:hypothetical protein